MAQGKSKKQIVDRKLFLLRKYAREAGIEEIHPGYPVKGLRIYRAPGVVWLSGERADGTKVKEFYIVKTNNEMSVYIDGILAGMRATRLHLEEEDESNTN